MSKKDGVIRGQKKWRNEGGKVGGQKGRNRLNKKNSGWSDK